MDVLLDSSRLEPEMRSAGSDQSLEALSKRPLLLERLNYECKGEPRLKYSCDLLQCIRIWLEAFEEIIPALTHTPLHF